MFNVWRKASAGIVAGAIATTGLFAITGIAGAATVASAAPAVHASAARVSATAALTWPVVKQGSTGERVIAIQSLLNARNGARLAVDGKFGPLTATAVKNFQKRFKLSVDGQVGPKTWAALIVTVKSGSSGQAVSAVQHNLRFAYGFTALAVDGVFGPKTAAAVKSFQSKHKLAADGIVGVGTWNALIVHE